MVQTLTKWSSKIQAVAPSVLLPSNRGTFLKGSQQHKSAAQLIDETLVDHEKLLAMTQISRGKKGRIGAPQESVDVPDAADPDIFDDTDFYQKILRDIIDARGDSNGGEDWMILQKQKKAKKKVDTKASKGRKLRFVNGPAYVLFLINLYLTGMKLMRSYKALWFQSPFLGHGMTSRLTSCSLRSLGKALRMWV